MIAFFAIVVIVLLIITAESLWRASRSQQADSAPNNGNPADKNANEEKRGSPAISADRKEINAASAENSSADNQSEIEKRFIDAFRALRKNSSVLTFFIAAIAAVIYGSQLSTMQAQLGEMKKQTAAYDRPWVGLDSSSPMTIDTLDTSNGLRATGAFTARNFGQRPAFKVTVLGAPSPSWPNVVIKIGILECSSANIFTTGDAGIPSQGQIVFPNGTAKGQFGPGPFDRITGSNLTKYWIAGCISYLDQNSTLHWTRFCYEIGDGKTRVTKDSPMEACQLYNDTDDTNKSDKSYEFGVLGR